MLVENLSFLAVRESAFVLQQNVQEDLDFVALKAVLIHRVFYCLKVVLKLNERIQIRRVRVYQQKLAQQNPLKSFCFISSHFWQVVENIGVVVIGMHHDSLLDLSTVNSENPNGIVWYYFIGILKLGFDGLNGLLEFVAVVDVFLQNNFVA